MCAEVDRMIATGIMGWTPMRLGVQDRNDPIPRGWNTGNTYGMAMRAWRPSTDIAQAIQAAEKWRSGGTNRSWNLDSPLEALQTEYCCQLDDGQALNIELPTVWAATPALAICKALAQSIGEKS